LVSRSPILASSRWPSRRWGHHHLRDRRAAGAGAAAPLGALAIVLAAGNGLARVYLGGHNPLDVAGGAAIGLIIAALLDMILDVARDHGRGWTRQNAPARENASPHAGPPEAGTAGQGP
jgi:membrane-associated phospholipid phosphatase